MKTQSEKISHIVEKLAKAEEILINRITGTAWKIAYSALWNGEEFSRTEINKARSVK